MDIIGTKDCVIVSSCGRKINSFTSVSWYFGLRCALDFLRDYSHFPAILSAMLIFGLPSQMVRYKFDTVKKRNPTASFTPIDSSVPSKYYRVNRFGPRIKRHQDPFLHVFVYTIIMVKLVLEARYSFHL